MEKQTKKAHCVSKYYPVKKYNFGHIPLILRIPTDKNLLRDYCLPYEVNLQTFWFEIETISEMHYLTFKPINLGI